MSSAGVITDKILQEQEICLSCGFCCDGTLFNAAMIYSWEKGMLPEKMEENLIIKKGKDYFTLPCHYFEGKCSIYNEEKARICSEFRCKLLDDLSDGKRSRTQALSIIQNARIMREEIEGMLQELEGTDEKMSFTECQERIIKITGNQAGEGNNGARAEIIKARCNILEAMLIRYFRSEKYFKKMISDTGEDENIP